jgi:HD superfamily phosphohydrolase
LIIDENLAFDKKALYEIENFILGRYHMYQTVYLNDKNLVFSELYAMFLKRLINITDHFNIAIGLNAIKEKRKMNYDEFMSLDDSLIMAMITNSQRYDDDILLKISDYILRGILPFYVELKSIKEVERFISENESKNKGVTWNIIGVDTDFKQYGSKVSETAKIFTDGVLKPISDVSSMIQNTTDETEHKMFKTIGVKI